MAFFGVSSKSQVAPLSMSVGEGLSAVDWRDVVSYIEKANADGLEMRGQIAPRAIGVILGLTALVHPLSVPRRASERSVDLPLKERVRALARPRTGGQEYCRKPVDAEYDRLEALLEQGNWIWEMGEIPDYEPGTRGFTSGTGKHGLGSIRWSSRMTACSANEGSDAFSIQPERTTKRGIFDVCRDQILHDNTVMGLGDGGAHVGIICDASFYNNTANSLGPRSQPRKGNRPTPSLSRNRPATRPHAVGLTDRGVIAPGMKAGHQCHRFRSV